MSRSPIRKELISGPTNFQHVTHIGKEEQVIKKAQSMGTLLEEKQHKQKKSEAEVFLEAILKKEAPSFALSQENNAQESKDTKKVPISAPMEVRHVHHAEGSREVKNVFISGPIKVEHLEHASNAKEAELILDMKPVKRTLTSNKAYISNAISRTKTTLKSAFASNNELSRDPSSKESPSKDSSPPMSPHEKDDVLPPLQKTRGQSAKPVLQAPKKKGVQMFLNQLFKIPNTRADRRAELDTQLSTVQTDDERQQVKEQWMISETEKNKKRREKISIKDFEIVQTLGHGGFGVVRLVRDKVTQEVFAMKALRKADMLKRGQEAHVRAERDLLSQASQVADWIVQLNCTFQDNENLYFVLEYMPGGDLLGLLIKLDIFPEDFAKHYCAEMVLAIEEVHKLGMIHRDVKPDNFLFNSEGHIKLADFGLATDFHWAHSTEYDYQLKRQATRDAPTPKDRKGTAFSIVGTANYIAPEVLIGGGYDKTCDWWSLGVILFECVFGYPPFCAKTQQQTRNKILNWKKTFQFPSEPEASYDCKDLIRKLICGADERLGNRKLDFPELTEEETKDMTKVMIKRMLAEGDASDIKKHPWFADIDWNNLHQKRPPFVPDPKRFYFDEVDEKEVERMHQEAATEFGPEDTSNMDERKRTAFMGFSYQSPQGMMPK